MVLVRQFSSGVERDASGICLRPAGSSFPWTYKVVLELNLVFFYFYFYRSMWYWVTEKARLEVKGTVRSDESFLSLSAGV